MSALLSRGVVLLLLGLLWLLVFEFLYAEQQWRIISVAVVAFALLLLLAFTRLGAMTKQVLAPHRTLVSWSSVMAGLLLIGALHEEHFALLMLTSVMLYAVACLGLTLQFGYAGVVNFAGAAFFGVGAYTAAVTGVHPSVPPIAVLLLGGVMAAALGSVLFLPILRTRGHYAALITIAFGILFKTFLEVNDALGGPQGLKVPGFSLFGWSFNDSVALSENVELSFYVGYALASLLLLVLTLILVTRLERSWIGVTLDAVRLDETAARVFGINASRWKLIAFSLGNFLAGSAGALYGMMAGFIAPTSFTLGDSLLMVSIVILGGMGNAWAVLPAAALVVVLPEKLQIIQEYRFLLFAMLVIVILLFRPAGLFPRALRTYHPESVRR